MDQMHVMQIMVLSETMEDWFRLAKAAEEFRCRFDQLLAQPATSKRCDQ